MAGLYLYDSVQLLASNEVLLIPRRYGTWGAMFGAESFLVRGKEPCLPNPFLPHRPLYRFSWRTEGLVGPCQPWIPPGNEHVLLAPFIWTMALALFVVLPLGLFTHLGHLAVAAGVILFYANALAVLALVWFKRNTLGISGKRFASLALESLSCPPFALNLVRHISLAGFPDEDFLSVADRLLPAAERAAALRKMIVRVKNEIDWEDEGTPRANTLNTHLQYLSQESDSCRALSS